MLAQDFQARMLRWARGMKEEQASSGAQVLRRAGEVQKEVRK
jgi:hypothetical protein